ncbi:MAG: TonB-dependent receptor family protein [Firmicutes bacterium]|nr:TonB-dependent receptor family protein [Bacillota bacterium]MCM1400508.1 TonB-dependent receptor family protein [Bacteroides sp.]MCM1476864.1 TonB-dependent receptor family protein [Bacteroides sp.]
MKSLAVIVTLLCITLTSHAYTFSGAVVNSSGEPQEFATFRVFAASDTVKPIAYGVADESGRFSGTLANAGNYTANVSVVGLSDAVKSFRVDNTSPNATLGNLICKDAANILGEVTVTATKPLVTKEIDRIGYDVKADIEAPTSNLQDVLRKVPLVSVDADGTIKIKGSSNFKIYKNGRPNNSFTNNAKEIFKAIPASMIKRIEVITDPGAREDAEGVGSILNIVTEQSSSLKGVMANVGLNYDVMHRTVSPNLWGSAQIDKVTLSAYFGMNTLNKWTSRSEGTEEGVYGDTGNRSLSSQQGYGKGNVNWWGIDGSYELDSLNLFTLEFGGYSYSAKSYGTGWNALYDAAGKNIYEYNTLVTTDPTSYLDFNGNFNYQHSTHRKGENFTLSYMISTTRQRTNSLTTYSDMVNMPVDYSGIVSDYKLNFMEHTFQADWTRPFGEIHTLDLGLKYIFRDNNSRTRQEYSGTDRAPVTDFTHYTHVAAAFADYRVRLGRFSLRGGVRYEFSRLSASFRDSSQPDFGSNLSDIVPNAAVSYNINDANTIKLSYGTRINRPGISYLNPAVNETPSSTSQGNPDLGSSRYQNIDFNYSFISKKVTLDFSANYQFSNNGIIDVKRVIGNHTYSGYANDGHDKFGSMSLFVQWMAGKKTTIMLNGTASYSHYANPSLSLSKAGWNYYAFSRLTQKLPWKITGAIGLYYYSGSVSLYNRTQMLGLSALGQYISLNRNFLKEDRLSVRLSLNNPVSPKKGKTRMQTFNTSYRSTSYNYSFYRTTFGVSVSYRFGKMSSSVKRTVSRIKNDDLVGRKSGESGGNGNGNAN